MEVQGNTFAAKSKVKQNRVFHVYQHRCITPEWLVLDRSKCMMRMMMKSSMSMHDYDMMTTTRIKMQMMDDGYIYIHNA